MAEREPLRNSALLSTTVTGGSGLPLARSGIDTCSHEGSVAAAWSASMEGVADPKTSVQPYLCAIQCATSRVT